MNRLQKTLLFITTCTVTMIALDHYFKRVNARTEGVNGMKQMIRIIRKVDVEKQYQEILELELDYELATLHEAVKQNDQAQIEKSKKRLAEIQTELKGLRFYA